MNISYWIKYIWIYNLNELRFLSIPMWIKKFKRYYFWNLCSGTSIFTQNLMQGFRPTLGFTAYTNWLRHMIKTYGDRGVAWDFRLARDIGTFEIKFRKQEDLVWYTLMHTHEYTGTEK